MWGRTTLLPPLINYSFTAGLCEHLCSPSLLPLQRKISQVGLEEIGAATIALGLQQATSAINAAQLMNCNQFSCHK